MNGLIKNVTVLSVAMILSVGSLEARGPGPGQGDRDRGAPGQADRGDNLQEDRRVRDNPNDRAPRAFVSASIEDSTVTLSANNDFEGDSISYLWSITAKPDQSVATLSSTTSNSPSFTIDLNGIYSISLIVNDGDLSSVADILTIISTDDGASVSSKRVLGESLFHDTSFSLNRTMSCATCHNPEQAFMDTRDNSVNGSVSLGDNGVSLGDRNTPSITYAKFTPRFSQRQGRRGTRFTGGQFLDGRASSLVEQASQPFLNPAEMQMPDASSVVLRLQEKVIYTQMMQNIYGDNIFNDTDEAFLAMADAIAAFEKTNAFSSFDSDFDTNNMSLSAQNGFRLFTSRQINCVRCHSTRTSVFSDFSYQNLGVPINTAVRDLNSHAIDLGLSENPDVNDANQDGKFKVSGLRNVAVSAPYMHNGVFADLKTVVHFYNTRDVDGAINPETNQEWEAPEVNRGIERRDVGDLGLSEQEEDDLVEYLKALTDERYKNLL